MWAEESRLRVPPSAPACSPPPIPPIPLPPPTPSFRYKNILWAEELAFPTAVVLSAADSIVPVPEVRRYFAFNPSVSHGT